MQTLISKYNPSNIINPSKYPVSSTFKMQIKFNPFLPSGLIHFIIHLDDGTASPLLTTLPPTTYS